MSKCLNKINLDAGARTCGTGYGFCPECQAREDAKKVVGELLQEFNEAMKRAQEKLEGK